MSSRNKSAYWNVDHRQLRDDNLMDICYISNSRRLNSMCSQILPYHQDTNAYRINSNKCYIPNVVHQTRPPFHDPIDNYLDHKRSDESMYQNQPCRIIKAFREKQKQKSSKPRQSNLSLANKSNRKDKTERVQFAPMKRSSSV